MPSGSRLGRFPLLRYRQKKGYARKFGRYSTVSKRRFYRRPTYRRSFRRTYRRRYRR